MLEVKKEFKVPEVTSVFRDMYCIPDSLRVYQSQSRNTGYLSFMSKESGSINLHHLTPEDALALAADIVERVKSEIDPFVILDWAEALIDDEKWATQNKT